VEHETFSFDGDRLAHLVSPAPPIFCLFFLPSPHYFSPLRPTTATSAANSPPAADTLPPVVVTSPPAAVSSPPVITSSDVSPPAVSSPPVDSSPPVVGTFPCSSLVYPCSNPIQHPFCSLSVNHINRLDRFLTILSFGFSHIENIHVYILSPEPQYNPPSSITQQSPPPTTQDAPT
jgi:hypothetical protein